MYVGAEWLSCGFGLALSGVGLLAVTLGRPPGTAAERARLVELLRREGIGDERVLRALGEVPRHEFVPPAEQHEAYANRALPIGSGQTISQPYVVAAMTEALELTGTEKVLEVGTGSGYQAAVLGRLAASVYSIEIDAGLCARAAALLARLGYENIHTRAGDGFFGWPEEAPFAAIMVTAAAPRIPERLVTQLADGGRLVVPIGDDRGQTLVVARKVGDVLEEREFLPVMFVPMTGMVRAGDA